jgi:outer membrane lipoprotein-sorting protein
MTSSRSLRRRAVWAVPIVTAGAIAAAAVLPSTASASAHPVLPQRSAAQLLAAVQGSTGVHLSGEIVETARLGLPELPGSGNSASMTWQSLITGTHSARVWVDGPEKQRLALLGQLSESDVIRNGDDLWTYSSDTGKAAHHSLSTGAADAAASKDAKAASPEPAPLTPLAAANKALAAIDPSTVVTVDPTARVAGQKAYTLVLAPRQGGSTVRKVLIAIDAVHNVPLRVQVFGAGSSPAFETAFQNISFARPASSVFRFTPPKGSTTVVAKPPAASAAEKDVAAADAAKSGSGPKVLGSGWSSVVQFPAGDSTGPLAALSGTVSSGADEHQRETAATFRRLTTALPNGDRLLTTTLINALITTDGRVLLGAVSAEVLQQAAAGQLR